MSPEPININDVRWKKRWRYFLALQFVLLLLFLGGASAALNSPGQGQLVAMVLAFVGTWLFVSLPVCVLYLLGRVHDIDLSPLIPSAESRKYNRELKSRWDLSDDEFFERYYSGSDIPPIVPATIRRCIRDTFGRIADRIQPADMLYFLDDEWDLYDLLWRVGREFKIDFPKKEFPEWDGTLGKLIYLTHVRIAAAKPNR